MVTQQGIPLFYPFKKNACVLPGRPELRMRSGNLHHEAICLCVFIVSAVFMKPLFANGFWTSYNRLFGTINHVISEFNKSDDLLNVEFTVQHGSEMSKHSGLCVAINTSTMVLLDADGKFESYPKDGQMLKDFYPTHTGRSYQFVNGDFTEIGLDSLMNLFAEDKLVELKIFGSKKFSYLDNGIAKSKKSLKLNYPNQLIINEINDIKEVYYDVSSSIAAKESEIQLYRTKHAQDMAVYNQQLQAYEHLKSQMDNESNAVKKEIQMIQFTKAKAPTLPTGIYDKIKRLETDIRKIKTEDSKKYQRREYNRVDG